MFGVPGCQASSGVYDEITDPADDVFDGVQVTAVEKSVPDIGIQLVFMPEQPVVDSLYVKGLCGACLYPFA